MLEKFIANLKQSLPAPLRKMLGDAESDISDADETSEKSHDTPDSETENNGDKKKKQLSMIIRVIVVIGLGYLAFDHFVLTEDPQEELANIPVKPRKKRIKPPAPENNVATQTEPAAPANPETIPSEPKLDLESAPVEVAPVENINIADKKIEEVQAVTEVAPVKIEEQVLKEEVPAPAPAPSMPEASELNAGESKSGEQVSKSLDSLIDSVDGTEKATEAETPKKETRLEDKIVADDTYSAPPAYEQLGRGLVYNCKDKYWACVDKLSYVTCNKNMKWNKSHGKAAECAVVNVYNSDEDCSVVQKYNVSASAATPFCQ